MVVIGSGVMGLAAAYHLNQRGVGVHLIDADQPGRGASWGSGGWISPVLSGPTPAPGVPRMGITDTFQSGAAVSLRPDRSPSLLPWMARFALHCTRRAHARGTSRLAALSEHMLGAFDELDRAGIDIALHRAGNLRVCLSPEAARRELAALAPMRAYGFDVPATILSTDELHELEPTLSGQAQAGFLLPSETHVEPGAFTAALTDHLRARGVTLTTGDAVESLVVRDGAVREVRTTRGTFTADAVLITAGLGSRTLLRTVGVTIPLRGGKGYSFFIETPQAPRHPMYLSTSKVGVTPMPNGFRVVGGLEFGTEDRTIDRRMIGAMTATARRYLKWPPGSAPTQVWAGLRPMTPDGLPIMDRIPDLRNGFVSTGHGMLGVGYSMTCGALMADFIVKSRKEAVLDGFSLTRFSW
ncbi:FAD-dependent oxidoreductase [Mycobacterium sp. AMU20-3851]|uniref:NAD(P)/FAD-dependent oxidoreductase n=1 Tax=Mycobacterium sp. AMU20-3851 TaxID=3122055 RepID=UPI0037548E89